MPHMDDMIDLVGQVYYVSTMYLTKGYWQIPVAKHDQLNTALITPFGLYQFKLVPLGAPVTLQQPVSAVANTYKLMDQVLNGLQGFPSAHQEQRDYF